MLTILTVFPLELLLGIALGFFLSDGKPGMSLDEVKISSLVFLLTNAFVMLTHPEMSVTVFAYLAVSWIAINIGMLLGELIRFSLISRILGIIAKKDVQLKVTEFVRLATRYGFTGYHADYEAAKAQLESVYQELTRVAERAGRMKNSDTGRKLRIIGDLCRQYMDTAEIVCREQEPARKQEALLVWGELGNTLTSLSWDTLNHAEEEIKKKLSRVWGSEIVRYNIYV